MNCKPQQLAFIRVPASYNHTGLQVWHNRVVRTQLLLPGHNEPIWAVEPKQRVSLAIAGVDAQGRTVLPGELMEADGIPDAWLRPFDPDSAPEDITQDEALEQPA